MSGTFTVPATRTNGDGATVHEDVEVIAKNVMHVKPIEVRLPDGTSGVPASMVVMRSGRFHIVEASQMPAVEIARRFLIATNEG